MLEGFDFSAEAFAEKDYKKESKALVERLVVLQQQARSQELGLVVLFEGWDGAGKGSRISDLVHTLDARATKVHVTTNPTEADIEHFAALNSCVSGYYPAMKQFWDALSVRGNITFFDRGWYTNAVDYLYEQSSKGLVHCFHGSYASHFSEGTAGNNDAAPANALATVGFSQSIESFERQLVDDGYIVLKFFVHISKDAQEARIKQLHNNPDTTWRVSEEKFQHATHYDEFFPIYDALLEQSDFDFCPWTLVNGEDRWSANLTIAQGMVEALEKKLAEKAEAERKSEAAGTKGTEGAEGALVSSVLAESALAESALAESASTNAAASPTIASPTIASTRASLESSFALVKSPPTVDDISSELSLDREQYRAQLKREQKRLYGLQQQLFQKRIPLMLVYEGWDAAGKGGNIKRVAQALDARSYVIVPSGVPTKDELLHPFLWRYWTQVPKAGHVCLYDRSWYGRVLVERVEGFATPDEWTRAFGEINEFERDMQQWGALMLKFWVNVSPDEQLERFEARAQNPSKYWKITSEDWRNREKYPQYKEAVDDMFCLTSTEYAPWIILESDNKLYARIKALTTINEAIEARLG
ncbi:MAG: hypothetical protein LBB42_04700 [Coriobacteriales bacterium]|jgi:polyphosphate kinase 2 (PPK2 family)|nr:hypothetical protein [Coriobacteriales bacterium]